MEDKLAKCMGYGSHGSTFGGNQLACSVALAVLKEVSEAVFHGEISLGIGVDWLEAETGKKLSRMGLKKYVDRKYGRLGKKS